MKVAIVDASAIDRRILERLVEREAQLEVAWIGDTLPPARELPTIDVVIVDPLSHDGTAVDVLDHLDKLNRSTGIVLFTRETEHASSWMERSPGQVDVLLVDKGSVADRQVAAFEREVLPWIASRGGAADPAPAPGLPARAPAAAELAQEDRRSLAPGLRLVLIGASTGGPAAVGALLRELPGDLNAAICITQHMPDGFTAQFAKRLDSTTPFAVREAVDGELLAAGQALVAPSGRHLELRHVEEAIVARLTDAPPENWCRPAVDRLFHSASLLRGPQIIATVLTGMGKDGELGAAALRDAGARVFAQNEESSVVWGMPAAVVRAGLADAVEDIPGLAARITRECGPTRTGSRRRSS